MILISPDELIQVLLQTGQGLSGGEGKGSRYTTGDGILGAFSVFFTQCPSFLDFQRQMEAATGKSNANSLFGMNAIPQDQQIRRIVDEVHPTGLYPVFDWCFDRLVNEKEIDQFKSELGYLIALDGTGQGSSETIYCKNCLTKTTKKTGKKRYYHSVLTPVLVKPGGKHIFPLSPEYISPQDGDTKQDCENKAAKRWFKRGKKKYTEIEEGVVTTFLGDDLYSKEPVIREGLESGFQYILVCKRESHPTLYEYVDALEEGEEKDNMHKVIKREWTGMYHKVTTYRYANHVPLKDSKDTIYVNWYEVSIKKEEDESDIYYNSFITGHHITNERMEILERAGRARWKVENEGNNTLKTQGYHFEHNYGHGDKNLTNTLTTLILIAFLFHILLDMFCETFIVLKEKLTRITLFNTIRTLTTMFFCPGWKELFISMRYGLEKGLPFPTIPYAVIPSG